jgi:hypothetical protein
MIMKLLIAFVILCRVVAALQKGSIRVARQRADIERGNVAWLRRISRIDNPTLFWTAIIGGAVTATFLVLWALAKTARP